MPDLAEEKGALVVHSLHDGFPGFHMLGRVDSRRARVAVAALGDHGAFGDQEGALRGSLGIVLRRQGLGDGAEGAAAGKWCVHNAVLELAGAELVRLEERRGGVTHGSTADGRGKMGWRATWSVRGA